MSSEDRFSEFKFLQEPEDVVVVRNRPAMLNCEASLTGPRSHQPPKIKWKRDGEILNFPDFNDRRCVLPRVSKYTVIRLLPEQQIANKLYKLSSFFNL